MTAVEQGGLDLRVKREITEGVEDQVVSAKASMTEAINLCVSASGLNRKAIYTELGIDAGQWSRIESGQSHFPHDKFEQLFDVAGNEIPLRWLAAKRGYGLVRLKTALERDNERLQHENETLRAAIQLMSGRAAA